MKDTQQSIDSTNRLISTPYKAIIIGASGMVGTQVLDLLLSSDTYTEVVSLVRRKSTISHPKLK